MTRIVIRHLAGPQPPLVEAFPLARITGLLLESGPRVGIRPDPDPGDPPLTDPLPPDPPPADPPRAGRSGGRAGRIVIEPGAVPRFRLVELDRRNGLFINGRRVPGQAVLRPGDEVRLGAAGGPGFIFDLDPRPAAPAPRPAVPPDDDTFPPIPPIFDAIAPMPGGRGPAGHMLAGLWPPGRLTARIGLAAILGAIGAGLGLALITPGRPPPVRPAPPMALPLSFHDAPPDRPPAGLPAAPPEPDQGTTEGQRTDTAQPAQPRPPVPLAVPMPPPRLAAVQPAPDRAAPHGPKRAASPREKKAPGWEIVPGWGIPQPR
ncbi:FHA domain-containing protein [Rhodovastum atsumiense]|uniref:FHA domain-containing protein n=1 Tax=Rhodovastum atsumiense TaxID=504468 RepID=A0A5M6IRR6_9PROT|nr:FHA domain-containing protein [Rhodovastum atsumiense]KAA5610268.1 FHA domain-containing protein [Rhodovastum atsumiense]CAH2602246.1 FHA domain-containing protein [Rhodovastum atsumiense]